eukprot:symbB.v1.2.019967.t1/scaffold1632.1/size108648/7
MTNPCGGLSSKEYLSHQGPHVKPTLRLWTQWKSLRDIQQKSSIQAQAFASRGFGYHKNQRYGWCQMW